LSIGDDPREGADLATTARKASSDGLYIANLTFQRERQLKAGARPRVDARGHTNARVALMEVRAGFVIAAP